MCEDQISSFGYQTLIGVFQVFKDYNYIEGYNISMNTLINNACPKG